MSRADDDRVWRALADPTRRDLLDALRERPRSTGDLCKEFGHLCRTAVMKHLDVLQEAGLLHIEREGRMRWNSINPVPIRQICERWMNRHVEAMASGVLRLKECVERKSTERK